MDKNIPIDYEDVILNQKIKPYIHRLGYRYLKNQVMLEYSGRNLRIDAIAYLDDNYKKPFIVIEIKSSIKSEITILHSSVQRLFFAATALGNSVKYILVTDGDKYFWFERNLDNQSLVVIEDLPQYNYDDKVMTNLIEDRFIVIRDMDQYHNIVMKIISEINKDRFDFEYKMALELNKIIVSKIYDEYCLINDNKYSLIFSSTYLDEGNVISEINNLYLKYIYLSKNVKKEGSSLNLSPETAMSIVRILENYAISMIPSNIIGKSFWNIFPSLLRKSEGKYITPKHLSDLVIKIANPKLGDKILDPACGTGLFLIESYNNIKNNFDINLLANKDGFLFTGIEINPNIAELAFTNLMLNSIPYSRVINENFFNIENINKQGILEEEYDLIVSNPPFGVYKMNEYIEKNFEILNNNDNKIYYIVFFIETSIKLLKDEGKLVFIVPDSFLELEIYKDIRIWILNNFVIKMIISLPLETFTQVGYSIKTSIILLEKRPAKDNESTLVIDIISLGYDRLGTIKRKSNLNDLLEIINNFQNNISEKTIVKSKQLISWQLSIRQIQKSNRLDIKSLNPKAYEIAYLLDHGNYPTIELDEIVDIIVSPNIRDTEKESKTFLLIDSSIIDDFYMDIDASSYIRVKNSNILNRILISPGDILIVNVGRNIGRAVVVDILPEPSIIHHSVFILRPKVDIDPFFVVAVICSSIGREQIQSIKSSTGIERIHKRSLSQIRIPLPPIEYQQQFTSIIKDMLNRSKDLTKQAKYLEDSAKEFIISALTRGDEDE